MKKGKSIEADELRPEYRRADLDKGVRGKYFEAYNKGTNLVLLSPEIAKAFPSSEAVNEALRGLLRLTEETRNLVRPVSKRASSGKRTG